MSTETQFNKLISIMAQLRNPEGGCSWDLAQDFKSIAPHTVEEAYEVQDAIEQGDFNELRAELGDLLFQVVFHAQMASEANLFTIEDVLSDINEKMIRRHPHVFDKECRLTAEQVEAQWDEIKRSERAEKQKQPNYSILDDVTRSLPSLLRASKLSKRAAQSCFEWPTMDAHIAKCQEEFDEVKEALAEGDKNHLAEEIGDVLFCFANLARANGINPEEALRMTNEKFYRRFSGVEKDAKAMNKHIDTLDLDEYLKLWKDQRKKEVKSAA
ncbi:MAG: nucleoside triphosphate pyrophosphohydrolase [Micavibrio sp.]|nr:nucleoside triphosphate pyrophosphohydrolase [Micavibrio sp.]